MKMSFGWILSLSLSLCESVTSPGHSPTTSLMHGLISSSIKVVLMAIINYNWWLYYTHVTCTSSVCATVCWVVLPSCHQKLVSHGIESPSSIAMFQSSNTLAMLWVLRSHHIDLPKRDYRFQGWSTCKEMKKVMKKIQGEWLFTSLVSSFLLAQP